jgi:broad specificity phosphatase PhoE
VHTITLMRHGRPLLEAFDWCAPAHMPQWIRAYDLALVEQDGIPSSSIALARDAQHLVCSDLPRALSSLQALKAALPAEAIVTVMDAVIGDRLYREAQLPALAWHFPRLPAQAWAAVLRALWILGYAGDIESLQAARSRSRGAAQQLIALAGTGNVLLIGHGFMNRLIENELTMLGWRLSRRKRHGYWMASSCYFPSIAS